MSSIEQRIRVNGKPKVNLPAGITIKKIIGKRPNTLSNKSQTSSNTRRPVRKHEINSSNSIKIDYVGSSGEILSSGQILSSGNKYNTNINGKRNNPIVLDKSFPMKLKSTEKLINPLPDVKDIKLFKCKTCKKEFCDDESHINDSIFACPSCHKCGKKLYDLHNFYLRIEGYQSKFLCIKCSEIVEREHSGVTSENEYLTSLEVDYLLDDTTPATFDSPITMSYRETDEYSEEHTEFDEISEKHIDNNTDINDGSNDSSPCIYSCQSCNKDFKSKKTLHAHRVVKHGDLANQPVKCRICDKTFENILKRHSHEINEHLNEETNMFKCPLCELEHKSTAYIEVHLMRHRGELPFICDICGKGYHRKGGLKQHMLSHEVKRPFSCNLCNKAFKKNYDLLLHLKRHTNERPFKCDQCDKTYKDLTDLRRHKFSHGGYEKKFDCFVCDKKFYENKLLRYHMRIHENRSEL